MSERQKGVQVHRPIIYGYHARLLTEEEKLSAPPSHTHQWTVFLTSATSPPPEKPSSSTQTPPEHMDYLPGGFDDLAYMLKRVTFRLHDTYANPSRGIMPVCEKAPYKVTETGWGEFTVQIRLQFVQESGEKPLVLSHPIKLHHWGTPIEGPASDPSQVSQGPAADAAKEGKQTDDQGIKAEVETPIASTSSPKPSTPVEPPTSSDAKITDTPASQQSHEAHQPTSPISIASKFPVHAWQYDEVVFSDPPLSFLSIMSSSAPTPLPAKNRRARDQREAHDARIGKKAKGRISSASASAARSRQGTVEPMASDAPPVPVMPGPGQAVSLGIPGEPGSADVPLEFTQAMERAEWNRLNDARIKIVAEMDQWRERLIVEEKELAKLKEENRQVSHPQECGQ